MKKKKSTSVSKHYFEKSCLNNTRFHILTKSVTPALGVIIICLQEKRIPVISSSLVAMNIKPAVIFFLASRFFLVQLKKPPSFVAAAIIDIFYQDFASREGHIDIISCERGLKSNWKIIDELLRITNSSVSFRLSLCDDQMSFLNTSSLLIFDFPSTFQDMDEKIDWKVNPRTRHKHLVYIANGTTADITVTFGFDIDKVAFLINESEKSIDLATSFMFTKEKCRENQVVVINRFMKDTMAWEKDNFYPNKYRNLYGCNITLATMISTNHSPPGINVRIMTEMSELLQFKLVKDYADSNGFETMLIRGRHDFYDVAASLRYQWSLSVIITSEQSVFVIPSGQPLTSLEKLLSPFDFTIWMLISATLLATFIGIQIISLASEDLLESSLGAKIGSPTMNFLSVFLSGGQTKVPKRKIARFIFVNFMTWSLIIRTCFQSLMYRALQLDLRHPPMKTLEDLRENNFKQLGLTADISDLSQEELYNYFYE